MNSNIFYQFGNDIDNNKIEAYLFSLQGSYLLTEQLSLGLGGEVQSGNDYGAPRDGKNKAFDPVFGTNHKFNGFMDYFYVGNHLNNVGLVDLFGNISYDVNDKSNISLFLHQFFAASKIETNASKNLGFEMDLVTSLKLNNFAGLKAGYSHFFTSTGIEVVKNNYDANSNDWGWIMLTIDPTLFKWPGETK